jgi:hypothetical protein
VAQPRDQQVCRRAGSRDARLREASRHRGGLAVARARESPRAGPAAPTLPRWTILRRSSASLEEARIARAKRVSRTQAPASPKGKEASLAVGSRDLQLVHLARLGALSPAPPLRRKQEPFRMAAWASRSVSMECSSSPGRGTADQRRLPSSSAAPGSRWARRGVGSSSPRRGASAPSAAEPCCGAAVALRPAGLVIFRARPSRQLAPQPNASATAVASTIRSSA